MLSSGHTIYNAMSPRTSLLKDPNFGEAVKRVVAEAEKPVSIDYVAHQLGINWQTARAALLNLALKRQLIAVETTKSFVFLPVRHKLGGQAHNTMVKKVLLVASKEASSP